MSAPITQAEAEALLHREALYLDDRRWDDWLGLFTEDAVYWVPAWRSEDETTEDPDRELSLIYYRGRDYLRERAWRISSGLSIASKPLPRTVHLLSGILLDGADEASATVRSNFAVHSFNSKRQSSTVFFGRYEHGLKREGEAWRIASKKITLLNDYIQAVVDIYSI